MFFLRDFALFDREFIDKTLLFCAKSVIIQENGGRSDEIRGF